MKTFLALIFLAACAATASAQSYTASVSTSQTQRKTDSRQPVEPAQPVAVGALPRAAQGNPLQMVNPFAPAKYFGPPQETVLPGTHRMAGDQHQREQPEYSGVILAGWRW